jgi:hypothetical protein
MASPHPDICLPYKTLTYHNKPRFHQITLPDENIHYLWFATMKEQVAEGAKSEKLLNL